MRYFINLLFLFVFISYFCKGVGFIDQAQAADLKEDFQSAAAVEEVKEGTRIVISTLGAAEYTSHWIDFPPGLIIEFQSKNVYSKIDNEVFMNQRTIKKITSRYYGKEQSGPLKSLFLELSEKVPYEIRQEDKAILIDIKTSAALSPGQIISKEIINQDKRKDEIIKRLEEMDRALTRIDSTGSQEIQPGEISAPAQITIDRDNLIEVQNAPNKKVQEETKMLLPVVSSSKSKGIPGWLFLLAGLGLVSGLGILIIKYFEYKWKVESDSELAKIKSRLSEKEERLKQEEVIRKAVEQVQIQNEKDYKQLNDSFESLKLGLAQKKEILIEKEAILDEKEQNSLQKEYECGELKKIVEALKGANVRRKMMGKSLFS